jgi:hypothetical protein
VARRLCLRRRAITTRTITTTITAISTAATAMPAMATALKPGASFPLTARGDADEFDGRCVVDATVGRNVNRAAEVDFAEVVDEVILFASLPTVVAVEEVR